MKTLVLAHILKFGALILRDKKYNDINYLNTLNDEQLLGLYSCLLIETGVTLGETTAMIKTQRIAELVKLN